MSNQKELSSKEEKKSLIPSSVSLSVSVDESSNSNKKNVPDLRNEALSMNNDAVLLDAAAEALESIDSIAREQNPTTATTTAQQQQHEQQSCLSSLEATESVQGGVNYQGTIPTTTSKDDVTDGQRQELPRTLNLNFAESASMAMKDLRSRWTSATNNSCSSNKSDNDKSNNVEERKSFSEQKSHQQSEPTQNHAKEQPITKTTDAATTDDMKEDAVVKEEDARSSTGSSGLNFLRNASFLTSDGDHSPELAHTFNDHTYRSPTKCDICDGLLVGLFSQGLKCDCCGMNVHRGQGKGEHDDCRAEALLMPCKGDVTTQKQNQEEQKVNLSQAIKEIRELAKGSPGFLKEVRAQMDKDLAAQAKMYVVKSGAEEERSKSLRRVRGIVVPLVQKIDRIQQRGAGSALKTLLCYHGLFSGLATIVTVPGFMFALWPTKHGMSSSKVMIHSSTVLGSLHVTLLLASFGIRKLSFVFQRKANICHQFLQDVFTVQAEADIGISVGDAAARLRFWSDRFVLSSAITCGAWVSCWYLIQYSMGTTTSESMTCPAKAL